MARRFRYYDNSPTAPDSEGNPHLRPELAWSLDLAYERHLGEAGLLSAGFFQRHIRDVILQELFVDNGRWVTHPVNNGAARVHGIELEARLNFAKLSPGGPDLNLRSSLIRNWSQVDAVPGPDNRLAQQRPLSANLGADWRPAGFPVTLGSNFTFEAGGRVQLNPSQTVAVSPKRLLDAYALWKQDDRTQWRLTLTNLLRQDTGYSDANGELREVASNPTATALRLTLEHKL